MLSPHNNDSSRHNWHNENIKHHSDDLHSSINSSSSTSAIPAAVEEFQKEQTIMT